MKLNQAEFELLQEEQCDRQNALYHLLARASPQLIVELNFESECRSDDLISALDSDAILFDEVHIDSLIKPQLYVYNSLPNHKDSCN